MQILRCDIESLPGRRVGYGRVKLKETPMNDKSHDLIEYNKDKLSIKQRQKVKHSNSETEIQTKKQTNKETDKHTEEKKQVRDGSKKKSTIKMGRRKYEKCITHENAKM